MSMTESLRKATLAIHVVSSVGWIGALAVFFAHAVVGYASQDQQLARASYLAMGVAAWFVILPLGLTSFVTGLVEGLGTAWGLFRHYWVFFKLALASFATTVLLLKLAPISALSDAAASSAFPGAGLDELRMSMVIHAAGGLVILVLAAILAVYKPPGLTPFGARRSGGTATDVAGMPRWVRKSVWACGVLMILLLAVLLHGGHGPGAHMHG
jgi:hypothetical protein